MAAAEDIRTEAAKDPMGSTAARTILNRETEANLPKRDNKCLTIIIDIEGVIKWNTNTISDTHC